ncbi:hypothetical protein KDM41_17370, partial [bacterium]|nr:hypothetical protein [bacterium]
DVGQVYDRALRHAGSSSLGLGAAGDRGRQMALGELQERATAPLLEQIALFGDLARQGIHSTSQPDREVQRLRTLAGQGETLAGELDRLELAWFSLTTGTNWRDLPRLTDSRVQARRDSLERAERGALADVRLGMGLGDLRGELTEARRQMDGMAELVALYQEPRWSPAWEAGLEAAAAKVPPSAGPTTRAYRNSAFALLRLKKAERGAAGGNLAFTTLYDPAAWPSDEVERILPRLRREAGRFADRTAPPLLAGTVGLYAALDDPETTIGRISESSGAWEQLQKNAAVRFDPDLYLDYLDRLRFEAVLRRTRPHGDPERIPAHLCEPAQRAALLAFADSLETLGTAEQWTAMADASEDPFLRRWSVHLAEDLDARLALRRREFSDTWTDCRAAVTALEADVKAGYDWSERWRALHGMATGALDTYGADLAEDPTQRPRLDYLRALVAALEAPRPLAVQRVTVRLDQDRLDEAQEIRLEVRNPLAGVTLLSEPFRIGPAAPTGTGWVGTATLDWSPDLSPRQMLTALVRDAAGRTVLQVQVPSLAQEGGPGLLVRPVTGAGGSVGLKCDVESYWGSLALPDLGLVF